LINTSFRNKILQVKYHNKLNDDINIMKNIWNVSSFTKKALRDGLKELPPGRKYTTGEDR
jgi:hypothetical protein